MKRFFIFLIMMVLLAINESCINKNNSSATKVNVVEDTVFMRTVLYHPGDYESAYYRIPAVITAKDGSLVAVTDKRKFDNGDLPQDIDIVCNYSSDCGNSWSTPYVIALGNGLNAGFGDAAIAHSDDDNGLILVFVGGPGLWHSTPLNPIRSYKSMSYDNGRTWSEPEEITDFIFGSGCNDPERSKWRASFFGSGNGLRTHDGRIMFVAAIRETNAYSLNNYLVYSDDNGLTWNVSERASVGGDEAKVVELNDGSILMSIRNNGSRRYNISHDKGQTWNEETLMWKDMKAPACNGDIIRYSSVNQGDEKNVLLHSIPFGDDRDSVSVCLSFDEGQTWSKRRCVVPYSSAYSSLCVLPDKTIGLYVEESQNDSLGYDMVFYRFNMKWLLNE